MLRLSHFFSPEAIVRDAEFSEPGHLGCEGTTLLVYSDNETYLKRLSASGRASCALVTPDLLALADPIPGLAVFERPRSEFFELHSLLARTGRYRSLTSGRRGSNCLIHPTASVDPMADLGSEVIVGPFAFVGANCSLGNRTLVEAGVRVGVEGILYFREEGKVRHVPHAGGVVVGEEVSLLSGSTIALSVHPGFPTRIGMRSIIGIGATIGHEAQVGSDVVVSGHADIARNVRLGDRSFVGPGAFVSENLNVGCDARVVAGSVVIKSVEDSGVVSGNFAGNHTRHLKELTGRI